MELIWPVSFLTGVAIATLVLLQIFQKNKTLTLTLIAPEIVMLIPMFLGQAKVSWVMLGFLATFLTLIALFKWRSRDSRNWKAKRIELEKKRLTLEDFHLP